MRPRLILFTLALALLAPPTAAGEVPREASFRYTGSTFAITSDTLLDDCADDTNFGGGCVELEGDERRVDVRVEDDTGNPVAFALFLDTRLVDVYCAEATDVVVLLGTQRVLVTIMEPTTGTLRCTDALPDLVASTPTQGTVTLAFR